MNSISKNEIPSTQTQIENAMLSLYNFYSNPNIAKCTPHSSKAIYFCSDNQCNINYICSECLIEKPEHFAKHYKSLIPIDDIKKFFKFIKFPVDQLLSSLSNEIKLTPVEEYYEMIKKLFIEIIDLHYKEYSHILNENVNEQMKSIGEPKANMSIIENKISMFIKEGKRNGIQSLIKNIESFIKSKDKAEFITGTNEVNVDEIKTQVKGIIDNSIKSFYGVNLNGINIVNGGMNSELTPVKMGNQIKLPVIQGNQMSPSRSPKSPRSPHVIDKQSIEEQFNEIDKNSTTTAKMKDFLENENSFSSPSRSANKRKELEIIQEEVIENITTETETNETNETPISTIPTQIPNFTNINNNKLEENIPHQETNDDDNESNNNNNNQHRKTIKNRLELLKQKIEKLKSSSNISSSNDNNNIDNTSN